jgi:N-acetylglucosaminyldiphosphoundecaprenol N-acetyl-beta-D-mannosaminyltransferase
MSAETGRRAAPPSYNLFGSKVTLATRDELLETIAASIAEAKPCVVASQNMHGMYVGTREESFERLHALDETVVHIDGMPIVLLCRLAGIPARRDHRATLVDVIWPLLELAAAREWRVFYLGAQGETLERGMAAIRARFPRLPLASHHGFVDATNEAAVVERIRAFAPQLVLVGMGMGRQERWILEHGREIGPACFFTVGACLEYVSGTVRTPPRWMGQAGLEWLFRLAENPRRFWFRYLIEPWVVLVHCARYALQTR